MRANWGNLMSEHLPADIRRKVALGLRLEHADYVTWFRILQARGWLTPGWPVAHGGPGWDHVQRYIFDEETLLGGAPRIIASGIQMLAPVLLAFGTEAQKQQYLPDILNSPTVRPRTLHGSDWPFPANALVFWNRLHPLTLLDLMAEKNLFLRDFRLKQALGLPPESFAFAADMLAVDHDAKFPDRR